MSLLSKSHKLIANRLEVGEIIQVLLINVEHDGLFRMKLPQGPVAFIRLHGKPSRGIPAHSGRTPQLRHPGTHCEPSRCLQLLQRVSQQCSRGGLAMHARHTNRPALMRQCCQQHRAAYQRNTQLLSQRQFRVIHANGRAIHHQVRLGRTQLFWGMPFMHRRPAFAQ